MTDTDIEVKHCDTVDTNHNLCNVKGCHVSRLIIEYYHSKVAHQGRGITVNEIRSIGYWISMCVSAVVYIIHHCVHWMILYKNVHTQITSDLPADRLAEVSPTTNK